MTDDMKFSTIMVGDDAITIREYMAITAPLGLGDACAALGYTEHGDCNFADPDERKKVLEMNIKLRLEYADLMLAHRNTQ